MTINDLLEELEADGELMTFSSLLKAWRVCDGKKAVEYARKLGIEKSTYADLESGRKRPSIKRAAEVAELLGVAPEPMILIVVRDHLRELGLNYKITLEKIA